MTWDVILMQVSPSITSIEAGAGEIESPLGTRAAVRSRLAGILKEADFTDRTQGTYSTPEYTIELDLGEADPVEAIECHLRGEEQALAMLKRICTLTGWRALNVTTGSFINFHQSLSTVPERPHRPRPNTVYETVAAVPVRDKKWWQFWK